MEESREYSSSSLNLAISAINFFYGKVARNKGIGAQHRPRQDKRLPMVLSKAEVQKMLDIQTNAKHKLLLAFAYSSGLRVGELVALKSEHIDTARAVVHVKSGKGRRDRCVPLSEKATRLLAEYRSLHDIRTWLFPGQSGNGHLTVRTAQKIFEKAASQAEIRKDVSIHSLRHAYATHLLENGTDIRHIQALLGHSSIRTTERYTHVAQGGILSIKSPLD